MWPNPQETPDLATFTEEILNGKLHFLCGEYIQEGKLFHVSKTTKQRCTFLNKQNFPKHHQTEIWFETRISGNKRS